MGRVSFFRDGRNLLVSIAVVTLCMLLLGSLLIPLFKRVRDSQVAYSRELSAARRVEALGATVFWRGSTVSLVDINRGAFPRGLADALAELSDLQVIDQRVDVPSDQAIADLRKVGRLAIIQFGGHGISDRTIECLKNVKGLRSLCLHDTAITDAGLVYLADFPRLEYLKIDSGAITDAGMCHLKRLQNLEGLDLRNLALTDAGLANLGNLKHLKTIRLYECKQITSRGVQALKEALPSTSIGWDKSAIPGDLF
jgi:hypothetical protein